MRWHSFLFSQPPHKLCDHFLATLTRTLQPLLCDPYPNCATPPPTLQPLLCTCTSSSFSTSQVSISKCFMKKYFGIIAYFYIVFIPHFEPRCTSCELAGPGGGGGMLPGPAGGGGAFPPPGGGGRGTQPFSWTGGINFFSSFWTGGI